MLRPCLKLRNANSMKEKLIYYENEGNLDSNEYHIYAKGQFMSLFTLIA